jgi:hypothetical protein
VRAGDENRTRALSLGKRASVRRLPQSGSRRRGEYRRAPERGSHYFRGAGAGYVSRVASEQGGNLHPVLRSRPRRRLRPRHNGRPRPDFTN